MSRLAIVRDLVDRASWAYYNTGSSIIEDSVFDALMVELRALDPTDARLTRVGAPADDVSALAKRNHAIPMGSQNKCVSREEFLKWTASLPVDALFHASYKMDGGSVSFEYTNGVLYRAVTRGDGLVGEDITVNARKFKGLPSTVSLDGKPFTGFVRGEVVMLIDDWKAADPGMSKNPRNLGNGISRRKDASQSELLTVFAFRAHVAGGREIAETEVQMAEALRSMGFTTAHWVAARPAGVWQFFEETQDRRDTLPFWIDGVVVKMDSLRDQVEVGESGGCPRGQIAMKFPAQGKTTVLREVLLSVGHTGAIIPTAKFDTVQIGGSAICSASLANFEQITALDVAVGDTVLITKQGDIIPHVAQVVCRGASRVPIPEPSACPACGGPVLRKTNVSGDESAMLFCASDDCTSRVVGKLNRWLVSLNILGVGDEILNALLTQMGVRDAADLYTLHARETELGNLDVGNGRFGEKRARKLLEEIEAKRALSVDELVGSLGVDGLGKRRVALIISAVPGEMDSIDAWTSGKLIGLADRAGVPNLASKITRDLERKKPLIERLIAAGVTIRISEPKPQVSPTAVSFCMTGALSRPKSYFAELMARKGFAVKDSVSAGLTYLVIADPNSTSSKAQKARALGIKTIGEQELLTMLGSN